MEAMGIAKFLRVIYATNKRTANQLAHKLVATAVKACKSHCLIQFQLAVQAVRGFERFDMKIILAFSIFLTICIHGAGAFGAEPTSGYIVTSEFAVNEAGKPVGQKRSKKIWFQGANVRIENLIGDEITEVTVSGENSWSAAPAAQRILFENQPRLATDKAPLLTYPEIVRRSFARFFGKRTPIGKEKINGLECWKYMWHEDEFIAGDIGLPAQDVTYWVYADEQFPFVVAHQSSLGGKQELVEFRQNEAVNNDFFIQPKNWPVTRGFQLPQRKFVIEFQEDRQSAQYGWKVHSRDLWEGDGQNITRTYTQTTTEKDGRVLPFSPPVETLSYVQASNAITNRLQTPEWFTTKQIGSENLLGFPVQVLHNIIEGLVPEKYFVTDHPLLGTICLKRITVMPTDESARGVTRLEFPEN